jgi:hypothetical protein
MLWNQIWLNSLVEDCLSTLVFFLGGVGEILPNFGFKDMIPIQSIFSWEKWHKFAKFQRKKKCKLPIFYDKF